jgi:DNA-directed RNA polymerase subunit RPC12/RpoP
MSASASCLKCGTSSFRHSRWRRKDGALKRLIYSAVRCQACGHRRYHLNLWGLAVAVFAILLTAFVVGVVLVISTDYGRADPPSLTSMPGLISNV